MLWAELNYSQWLADTDMVWAELNYSQWLADTDMVWAELNHSQWLADTDIVWVEFTVLSKAQSIGCHSVTVSYIDGRR